MSVSTERHVMDLSYDSADGGMWWVECENPACIDFDDQRHLGQWYSEPRKVAEEAFGLHMVEVIAALYADHPDYRDEWKP